MTTTQLKEYINKNNKIEYILEKLGCHNISKFNDKGNNKHYSAAFPDGNNTKGIIINKSDYLNFYSYSRGIDVSEKKDIIDLVQIIKKCNFIDALHWLHDINEIPFTFKKAPQQIDKKPNILNIFTQYVDKDSRCDVTDIKYLDENVLKDFVPLLFIDWLREGVIPKTAKKFGLMYSYDTHRVIIPIKYWVVGKLIGYNARTTIKDYDLLGITKFYITKTMRKTDNLYGLWENREEIEKSEMLCICEAEKGVLKMDSRGDHRWVALEGKTISSEQKRIILGLNIKEIVISLDNDVPIEHIWALCEKFYKLRKVSFTRDVKGLLGAKDSITDSNKKMCEYFIKNRIVYNETLHKKYLEWLNNK